MDNACAGWRNPLGSKWVIYPRLRVRAEALGLHREVLWNYDSFNLTRRSGDPNRTIVSQSAGWPPVGSGARATPVNITFGERTYSLDWIWINPQNPLDIETEHVVGTMEGTEFDALAYRDLFWNTVYANADVWPAPPAAGQFLLQRQFIEADGSISTGNTFISTAPSRAFFEISGFGFRALTGDTTSEQFRTNVVLTFVRKRVLYGPVGEIVSGAFGDFDYNGVPETAIDCTRGFSESIEKSVPPRIPQAILDNADISADPFGKQASTERRLIPPDGAHSLITC